MDDRLRIGELIKKIRIEKGLSQADLADLTGLKQHHVSRIEKGLYSTGVDILSSIASALGKKIDFV